jgi:hypothetical protein
MEQEHTRTILMRQDQQSDVTTKSGYQAAITTPQKTYDSLTGSSITFTPGPGKRKAKVAYTSPQGLEVKETPWCRSPYMVRFPKRAGVMAGRRYYSDLGEAKSAISKYENGKTSVSLGKRATDTFLYAQSLLGSDEKMEEAVRFYIAHHGATSKVTFGQLTSRWREKLTKRARRYRETAEAAMKKAEAHIKATTPVSELSRAVLVSVVEKFDGYWTQRAVAKAISGAFNQAIAAGVLPANTNPIARYKPDDNRPRTSVKIMRHHDVHDLLMWLKEFHPEYVDAVALKFYLGIRTEELCRPKAEGRRPLYWSDITWGNRVHLPPEVAKGEKERMVRFWPEALSNWLSKPPTTDGPVMPYVSFGNILSKLIVKFQSYRRKEDLPPIAWDQNVIRHTCASHWLALPAVTPEQIAGRAQIAEALGNSEAVLKEHYRNVEVTSEESVAYFSDKPDDQSDNVTPIQLSA